MHDTRTRRLAHKPCGWHSMILHMRACAATDARSVLTCGAKTRVKCSAACQALACSGALGTDGHGQYSCPHLATHRPSPSSRRSAQACASRTSSWSSILSGHKRPGLLRIILSIQTVRKTQTPPRQRAPYPEDLTFRCRHSHFMKCATQLDPSEIAPSVIQRFTSLR